jgi:hypothetical protein
MLVAEISGDRASESRRVQIRLTLAGFASSLDAAFFVVVDFAMGLEAVAVVLDFLDFGASMSSSEAFRFVAVGLVTVVLPLALVGAALALEAAVSGADLDCLVDAVGVVSVPRAFLPLGSISGSSDLRFVALGLLVFAWVVARLSGDLRARFEARVGAGAAPDSATFLRGMFTDCASSTIEACEGVFE